MRQTKIEKAWQKSHPNGSDYWNRDKFGKWIDRTKEQGNPEYPEFYKNIKQK